MSTRPAILVFGHDQSLLDTRMWVLEGAGYRVAQVSQLADLEEAAAHGVVRLVVLCHTLSPQECEDTLTSVRRSWPSIKRLIITANSPLSPAALKEPCFSAFDGPLGLISAVGTLVAPRE